MGRARTGNIELIYAEEVYEAHDTRHNSQSAHTENGCQAKFMNRCHTEAPYHGQGQNDQNDICCDVKASIGKVQFLLIDRADWFHGFIPTRVDRVGEEDVEEEGGRHVHAIEADQEPAHCVKPSLDENAAVKENEGDAGRRIGKCVENVGSVAGLE